MSGGASVELRMRLICSTSISLRLSMMSCVGIEHSLQFLTDEGDKTFCFFEDTAGFGLGDKPRYFINRLVALVAK